MAGDLISFLILSLCTGFSILVLCKFIKYIVLFSKIAFALIGALVLCQFVTVVSVNGILNFLVIFAFFLVFCFLLGKLPRVNMALTYFLNLFLVTIVGTLITQQILPKLGFAAEINKYILLLVYAVCAVISFRVLMDQLKVEKDLKYLPLRMLDRLVGAALNTASLFYVILQTVNFPDNVPLFVAALAGSLVLFYIADLLLFSRIAPLATGRKMPSEIRHLLEKDWSRPRRKLFSLSDDDYQDRPLERDNSGYDWAEEERKRREQALEESFWAAKREQEEYDYYQKQVESANQYYEDNYS